MLGRLAQLVAHFLYTEEVGGSNPSSPIKKVGTTKKEKQAIHAHNHYLRNKEKVKERARAHNKISIERNRNFIWEYLSQHPCIDCKEDDPIVLQFDHVRGTKTNAISIGVNRYWSIRKLQEEMGKCEVRCANCHTRKTAKEVNSYRYKKGL